MDVSENSGTPKWMIHNGKPYFLMDYLGVPLFLETPIYQSHGSFGVESLFRKHNVTDTPNGVAEGLANRRKFIGLPEVV